MKGPHYLVFSVSSTRKDEDISEEVQDALDEYLEDEWDIIAWRRPAGTRFIIKATVQARLIQSDEELKLKSMAMSHLLGDMQEPDVEWIIPKKAKVGTIADMARRRVDKWLEELWPTPPKGDGLGKLEDDQDDDQDEFENETVEADNKPIVSFVKKSAEQTVLDMFGLSGSEKDSEGKPLGLFTIGNL